MPPRTLPSLACLTCLTLAACGSDPEGTVVVSAPEIGSFAIDGGFVYYTALARPAMAPEIWRAPVGGGERELLHRSTTWSALPPDVLAVDGEYAWWLERCGPPDTSPAECQRLYRVPLTAAGSPELVLEDDIYDIALDGDQVFFTTSDERGLQTGVPGGVFAMPRTGGAPTALATDLVGLRGVEVHGDFVYTTDVVGGWEARVTRFLRVPRAGGEPEILADFSGEGGWRASYTTDGVSLFWSDYGGLLRMPIGSRAMEVLYQSANPISGYALDPAGFIYVTDPGAFVGTTDDDQGDYVDGAVVAVRLDGGPPKMVAAHQHYASGVLIAGGDLYWHSYEIDDDEDETIRTVPLPPAR
jgi:hypothetical protein